MIFFQVVVIMIVTLLGGGFLAALLRAAKEPTRLPSPLQRRAGIALIGFAVFIFLTSGTLKLAQVPLVVEEMASLGLAGWKLTVVGVLEITTGLLFMVPRTRSLGLLVASAYLGGGICAHFAAAQYFAMFPTMMVLGCCWLGASWRHPQILWSFGERIDARPAVRHRHDVVRGEYQT